MQAVFGRAGEAIKGDGERSKQLSCQTRIYDARKTDSGHYR